MLGKISPVVLKMGGFKIVSKAILAKVDMTSNE